MRHLNEAVAKHSTGKYRNNLYDIICNEENLIGWLTERGFKQLDSGIRTSGIMNKKNTFYVVNNYGNHQFVCIHGKEDYLLTVFYKEYGESIDWIDLDTDCFSPGGHAIDTEEAVKLINSMVK